jgi:hypothetical protein
MRRAQINQYQEDFIGSDFYVSTVLFSATGHHKVSETDAQIPSRFDCSLFARPMCDGPVTNQPVFVKIFSPLAKVFSFS